VYLILAQTKKVLGCIQLEAREQKPWLKASLALVTTFLVFKMIIHLATLLLVQSEWRWTHIKMRRHWATVRSSKASK
jgi:hypothetical protein